MRILKIYQVHVNVTAEEVYLGLLNDNFVLEKIRTLYEGKCLASTLVLRITRILEQSGIYPSKSLTNGSSDLDVCFEAEALVYNRGDIIVDCEIRKIENTGQIVCIAPNATVRLEVNRMVQALGEGALVPALVRNSTYTLGKPEITVTGEIYLHPEKSFTIYKAVGISKSVSGDTIEQFQLMQSRIVELESQIRAADAKTRDFFEKIFYPWKAIPQIAATSVNKKTTKTTPPKSIRRVSLESIIESLAAADLGDFSSKFGVQNDNLLMMQHPYIPQHVGDIYLIDHEFLRNSADGTATKSKSKSKLDLLDPDAFKIALTAEQFDVVLYEMLSQQYNYLTMVHAHCQKYDTPEKRTKNQKTWNFYARRQK